MSIDTSSHLVDCLGIVSANKRLETYYTTVNSNGVSPILCHPRLPNHRMFESIVPVMGVGIPIIKSFRCLFGPGLKIDWDAVVRQKFWIKE